MSQEISLQDWLDKGESLFGKDKRKWAFKCPNCGHIQTINDFLKLKDEGIDVDTQTAYFSCIGRFIESKGTIATGTEIQPCNYTQGGLFKLSDLIVVDPEGDKHSIFEFAEVK